MKVSVVIPTYRRPHLLERVLRSVEAQTFRDFEVIVVDDCSPEQDAYERVISSVRTRLPDFRFLRNETNRGAPHSRNRGILAAKHELIALIDDDDEWLPDFLKKQMEVFENAPADLGFAYTWTRIVDQGVDTGIVVGATPKGKRNEFGELLRDNFVSACSMVIRKEALLRADLFDESLPSCQDWDMWVRILGKSYRFQEIRSVEAIAHHHEGPSIGKSKKALRGYYRFYWKNRACFVQQGLALYWAKSLAHITKLRLRALTARR